MKKIMTILMGAAVLTGCGNNPKTTDTPQKESQVVLDTALTAAEKQARVFSHEVMWKMGRLGNSSVSADGKHVIYTLTHYNMADNKGYTALWVQPVQPVIRMKAAPGDMKQLVGNNLGVNSPVWGPVVNGKQSIYFLSNKSGSSQLWRVEMDGSNLTQMSDLAGGIDGFGISPAGDKIWYVQEVKVDKVTGEDIYGEVAAKSKARAYDDLMERHWDSWEDGSYYHIFVADFDASKGNGSVRNGVDIMPGEAWDAPLAPYFDMHEIAWNTDGKSLAYTCKKLTGYAYAMSTDSDIYLYTVADGKTRNLTEGMPGYDKYPAFSPDGTKMAWLSMERPINESDKDRLMVLDLATGEKSYLTQDFDYNAANLKWGNDRDGKQVIYFIAPMQGRHQICSVTVEGAKVEVLSAENADYIAFDLAGKKENAQQFVAEKTTISMATELFTRIDNAKAADEQITFINKDVYDNVDMGEVQERWVKTSDGKEMLTWVILPPNFDPSQKYPTLLYCQGGPQSVVSQRWSYRWNFQLMAAQGYVVVAPNRRGLPSFGQEWLDQISGDYSGQNIRDYLAAIDNVAKEPWADADRMGCVGASYGGYSAFYLMGHHQKRFKAFIAHCGMFNLESFYGETEELWFPTNDLGGPYWDRDKNKTADRSYKNSPHLAVNNWDTPILIIAGANDFRIPYTQSLQAFTAAKAHGLPARLLYFEDEAHQVFKPQNAWVWHTEFFAWLDKYLKP